VTGNADTATTAGKFSTTSGDAPTYACRAWVNFNGTSVTNVGGEDRCTIRESGNVSKVVRTGTGQYTVHFSTAMPSTNYVPMANYARGATWVSSGAASAPSTASTCVVSVVENNANYNGAEVFLIVIA
jgi:hypothetical protein